MERWVLALVDEDVDPLTCQLRFGGELQVTHLRHAAWLLETSAQREPVTLPAKRYRDITWSDSAQVCVIEWEADRELVVFHGKPMTSFHLISAAEALRERASTPWLQGNVLAVLQSWAQAQQEQTIAQRIVSGIGNGGAAGILGR